jgi:hypothetical protein
MTQTGFLEFFNNFLDSSVATLPQNDMHKNLLLLEITINVVGTAHHS